MHGSEVSAADYQKQDAAVEILTAARLRRLKVTEVFILDDVEQIDIGGIRSAGRT